MLSRATMRDFPTPPFPSQPQNVPGSQRKMEPYPDCGEQSYTGHNRLEGKIALITGADSGIGRAVAIAYAREGADVAIAYLNEHEDAEETARWVESTGRQCLLLPGDLAQKQHCYDIVEKTVSQFGRIDILVNNAAFQMSHETLEEIDDDEWVKIFDTNITAIFRICQAALPSMPKGGSIINTSSVNSDDPSPSLLAYATTKGAIANFTAGLAQLLGKKVTPSTGRADTSRADVATRGPASTRVCTTAAPSPIVPPLTTARKPLS